MKKIAAYLFFLVCPLFLKAQVNCFFQPQLQGTTFNGLLQVRLNNSYATPVGGVLKIRVRELSSGEVVTIIIPDVKLQPGSNGLNRGMLQRASTRYGNAAGARILSNTGKFPEGTYQYCYEFSVITGKQPEISEQCFDHVIMPLTPLLLIDPYNEARICNKRPELTWQPPMPMEPGMRFRVILVETDSLQERSEAIFQNTPIINQGNVVQNWLRFPANAPSLTEGRFYAWQVLAYKDQTILVKSEIWRFKVDCEKVVQPPPPVDSYRELRTVLEGDYYVADKVIRFSLNNAYSEGPLQYTITDLAAPGTKPKRLPEIRLKTGVNNIDLDVQQNKYFHDGGQYLLKVNLAGQELLMRFIYKK